MTLEVLLDDGLPLQEAVNQLLRPLIGSFKATTASVIGNDGCRTETYSTIIHASEAESSAISIDSVAAVADCYELLTIEVLQTAYRRIVAVKSVPKTDRVGPPTGDIQMTTGIVIARTSDLTLEEISSEIGRLNAVTPSHHWPDAVAVLSSGIINYSVQIPGTDRTGDFFLPAQSTAAKSPSPSMYVKKVIRATGKVTINKIASLIMCRVAIFQPGIAIPNYKELIGGVPTHGVVTETYQFNLANTLVAMTKEQAIATLMPQDRFNIASGRAVLGSVQFQEWQDGGVFVVRGAFPIDLFLIFLKEVIPHLPESSLQLFRGEGIQVSYVLPMNRRQFAETLARFQSRSSNITIRRDASKIVVQKMGDEGTSSPFVARLMMGVLSLRDAAYETAEDRNHFDDLYENVLSGLQSAREASQEIERLWTQHAAEIESGEIVSRDGRTVHINKNIDRALKRELESFLTSAVRTIKTSLQIMTSDLGIEIGFLFQKEAPFHAGVARTRISDAVLADYLAGTRQWSEPLLLLRNNLEHVAGLSPKVSYDVDRAPVAANEPEIDGEPITQLVSNALGRVCCFVEELTVFCLRKKLPRTLEITEIPQSMRDPVAPERFRLTLTPGGSEPWTLSQHGQKFDEA